MSDYELDRETELTAEEEQALHAVLAAPELNDEDWEALHARVTAACQLPLARRRPAMRSRRAGTFWWLRPVLPLAAAALLLIIFRLPFGGGERSGEAGQAAASSAAERALLADVSDAEFAQLVAAGEDAESLLLMAVER
ncbi:MAG: hypothetical protein FIB01_00910 [Gemmatimonadetes bacterium]|nr:hypothetical protein [Gemmatimonadota bacterium]